MDAHGGENYLRKRITTLEITYEIKGLAVATPRNRRPLLQGSHRQCLGPLIWESVGEPRYSLNASSDEAPLCFWVSRITVANRSPDRKYLGSLMVSSLQALSRKPSIYWSARSTSMPISTRTG